MIGWLQCSAGVSGNMLLGALVDAGVPLSVIAEAVEEVAPERVRLRADRVIKKGIAATKVHVDAVDSTSSRTWHNIRAMLVQTDVPGRNRALRAFESLATAEANVHGTSPEQVHFHEVGALDAIADVVGACAGFAHLGLDRLVVSPVALGGGTVRAAHGELAVPGPAVVRLLLGVPTYGGPVPVELTTPIGAALVTAWASSWGEQPAMEAETQGFGAGTRHQARARALGPERLGRRPDRPRQGRPPPGCCGERATGVGRRRRCGQRSWHHAQARTRPGGVRLLVGSGRRAVGGLKEARKWAGLGVVDPMLMHYACRMSATERTSRSLDVSLSAPHGSAPRRSHHRDDRPAPGALVTRGTLNNEV